MYLALAIQLDTHLITADRRLYNAVAAIPTIAPHVRLLRDY
jgi:predicted nucleic acid-binding protein